MRGRPLPRRLPAIDLHLHLEGSLPDGLVRRLARRHGLPVPPWRGWIGLGGFLKAFGAVCDLLVDEEDFAEAAHGVLSSARRRGLVHVEVLFSPQVFLRRGIPLHAVMRGLLRGRDRALREGRLSVRYIADGVRQWGGEWFAEVVRALAPYAPRHVAGIGVGGDETGAPARDFAAAFRLARGLGLRTTIHAGEVRGPEAVWEAIEHLHPDRVGHGIGAAADPRLMAELSRRRVALEVCPTSNVRTGAVTSAAAHPVGRLLAAGVRVTIGSDDGLFFGTDAPAELERLVRTGRLTRRQAIEVTRNAARAAFLPPGARLALEREVAPATAAASGAGSAPAR